MPLAPLLLISAVFHLYVGARLVPALPGAAAVTLGLLLVASALLMPTSLVARRLLRPPAADRLTWTGMLLMGLFSSLLVFTVLRDALLLAAWVLSLVLAGIPLALLAAESAIAVPVLALAATVLGLFNARRTAGVVTVDVPITGLPPGVMR